MTSIDLGVNNLNVSLKDYIGNTAAACKIELPAPGRTLPCCKNRWALHSARWCDKMLGQSSSYC